MIVILLSYEDLTLSLFDCPFVWYEFPQLTLLNNAMVTQDKQV